MCEIQNKLSKEENQVIKKWSRRKAGTREKIWTKRINEYLKGGGECNTGRKWVKNRNIGFDIFEQIHTKETKDKRKREKRYEKK